jgi:peptidoglycan L-alanyl-D-glutamate endopeptidase CwlK
MTNQEVYQNNQRLLSQVNPSLASAARKIIEGAQQSGYTLIVAEGYRTVQKQNEYYAQGRTKPGNIITYKKGGESKHNIGEAVDFDFIINGRQSNASSNNWSLIGSLAGQFGLIWGGDWKSFKDLRHVEMPQGYVFSGSNDYSLPSVNISQIPTEIKFVAVAVLIYLILDI